MNVKLAEKPFYSIMGEGSLSGTPMTFVRFSGCDILCQWCDTKYAQDPAYGEDWEFEKLIHVLSEISYCKYIVLTGGEPLLKPELVKQFCLQMGMYGKKVLVETSGTKDISVISNLTNVTIDCDIKPPSAMAKKEFLMKNLKFLRRKNYLKVAIASQQDYDWFKQFYLDNRNAIKCDIYLQPVVCPTTGYQLKDLAENILEDKLPFKLGFQLHKLIWGFERSR